MIVLEHGRQSAHAAQKLQPEKQHRCRAIGITHQIDPTEIAGTAIPFGEGEARKSGRGMQETEETCTVPEQATM